MAWRLAKSLNTLRTQINTQWPDRSKVSDGTIGDTAHSSRPSDHNPNSSGVVTAFDITHDPAHGVDIGKLFNNLMSDDRIKYLIWNRRIWYPASGWKAYSGTNPHTKHGHISVSASTYKYDDPRKWTITAESSNNGDMYDGKSAQEWYLVANDWHVRADDRQKVIERLENEVQERKANQEDLEHRIDDLTAALQKVQKTNEDMQAIIKAKDQSLGEKVAQIADLADKVTKLTKKVEPSEPSKLERLINLILRRK